MDMKLTVFIMLIAFVTVFTGFAGGSGEQKTQEGSMNGTMEAQDAEQPGDAGGETASGAIIEYTNMEAVMAAAENGQAVLFFNASWCPTCRAALADIASRQSELGDITVFLTDYDKEKALKQTFGVSAQHTYVQVDSDGNAVTMWNGGATDMILMNVERMDVG